MLTISKPLESRGRTPGEIIDFSGASRYYVALAQRRLRQVGRELTSVGVCRYRALPEFFNCFSEHLSKVKKHHASEMTDADLTAVALFRASVLFQSKKGEKPISRFRELLSDHHPTWLGQIIGPGPIREGTFDFVSKEGISQKFTLCFGCGLEFGEEPWVKLGIEGDPVRALAMALYSTHSKDDRKDARKTARRVWMSVFERLYVLTRTKNLKGGRPSERDTSEANFLHYTCGLPWSAISRELCRSKTCQHDAPCRERFRKAVEQYRRRRAKKKP